VAIVLGLCAIAGGLDEGHQSFVPGRVADPLDGLLDLLGAIAGVAFFHVLPRAVRVPATETAGTHERIPA
jgi:VanZ family protein